MNGSRFLIVSIAALAALGATAPSAGASPTARGEGCPKGFRCLEVTVPLDRSGAVPGSIDIPVAVQKGDGPLMLALGGGPGQGMVRVAEPIGGLLADTTGHRIAVLDQRGTGALAIRCPELQDAALTDFTPPPADSVETCGAALGAERALYSTTETVADLDAVRAALGVERMALLGVSYGTYTAERYARAFPDRVTSLVLDSVVPQENVDPFFRGNMSRSALVLDQLCTRRSRCARTTDDPVGDLRRLVEETNSNPIAGSMRLGGEKRPLQIDGPALFDLVAGLASFTQEEFPRFPAAVEAALRDEPKRLLGMYRDWREHNYTPNARHLSWGLHAATLCADVPFPWGSPATEPTARDPFVDAAATAIPEDSLGPFDRETAAGNGILVTCERWPATSVAPAPEPGPLPAVPILIMNGTWDLSTPLADARTEAERSPTTQFVKLREVGHSTITAARCAQATVFRFYAERPLGKPCSNNRAPRN